MTRASVVAQAIIRANHVELAVGEEHLDAIRGDACCSLLGELVAPILPAAVFEGSLASEVDHITADYLLRICIEEVSRIARVFGEASSRVSMPVTTPLLLRVSRLSRIYPWIKLIYNNILSNNPRLIRDRCVHAARRAGLEVKGYRIYGLEARGEELKASGRFDRAVSTAAPIISQLVSPNLIAEGLSAKPHPLLRDPLAGVRVGSAPVALRTLSFEDHLYIVTGVKKALAALKGGGIRAAKRLVVSGFTTAIVKDYRSPIAAKWLLAAILTLHLPRPKLSPRRRLNTEIAYTYTLMEKGFNVHEPLLVDPRRLKAAFRYVEGVDLTALLKKTPTPPHYRDLGVLLAELHGIGISLWDTNPSNFVVSKLNEIYIVDLEQARRTKSVEEKAWDIAMAVYYSALYGPREAASRAKMLAEGYIDGGGHRAVLEEAAKPKYMLPFIMAISPTVLEKCRKTLAYVAKL